MAEDMSNALPAPYVEVRDRIRIHLHQIRKASKKHPEYTVAIVIAVATELLGRLEGLGRASVFKSRLRPYGAPAAVAHGVFRALRNGLAHRYDTGAIDVDGKKVILVIRWNDPRSHLDVRVGDWLRDGVQRPGLFLCTGTLWTDLLGHIRRLERRMRESPALVGVVEKNARRLDR